MGASWLAQVFRQTGVTQSGHGAFPFLLLEDLAHFVFADLNCRCGGWGGLLEVLMVVWSGVGCFFKPAVELIHIVCQLLILHRAGGWCLVVGYLFQTFPH